MQSSLDLGNAGFRVYLLEGSPAIGGRMAQLDKTFPTNDCSMCIVSPKLVEAGRHKNIELLTHSELKRLEGEQGSFVATVRRRPRYVDVDACTGCAQCEIVCPVTHRPYFPDRDPDTGKIKRKKKSEDLRLIAFKDALRKEAPFGWTFSVDHEKCKKCGSCFRYCPVGAITWEKGRVAEIREEACIHCGACFAACQDKFSAIRVENAPELERGVGAALLARSERLRKALAGQDGADCLRCGLCQVMCEKVMGTGALRLTGKGIEAARDICRVCGACVSICPVGFLALEDVGGRPPRPLRSEFNERLAPRKPIDIKYPQAVPRVPVIDEESCVRLNTGACGTCRTLCDAGAIDYDQSESIETVEVGSVILSPGYEVFDARKRGEFGYGVYRNVVTALEFERLLSASGPTGGEGERPSDRAHPRKVAWIQCVGSRDVTCDRDYCSSVCCMYATKQAVIAKEHDDGIEAAIFYIDMRAFGKGFDDYVTRAKEHHGVRYVRSMVSRVFEDPKTHELEVRYVDERGEHQRESFDMVVLSVGVQIAEEVKALLDEVGVATDRFGFARNGGFDPLSTSRPGVFVSGVLNGPKDIPETVSEASGAACKAAAFLHEARGGLEVVETLPSEREAASDGEARIGAFICHCGINIASVVDVAEVTEYAKSLPSVVYAEHPLYSCSQDTQERMRELIDRHRLTHVVVAACSPRTHEPIFQDTMSQAGLNKYMFDMANIRDQCSWVHQQDKEGATEKAKRLVRMAVANVLEAQPLQESEFDVTPSLLVIGGGLAGMTAALEAAEQGFEVYLVEKERELGGNLTNLRRTLDGLDVQSFLAGLRERVRNEARIHVFAPSEIVAQSGFVGNFETEVMTPAGTSRAIKHGAIIVATGGRPSRPAIHGLGERERVMTQLDFEALLEEESALDGGIRHVVMLQCAGSRDPDHLGYCSRVCCNQAVKNAARFKSIRPEARVDVLYRDMRTYGHGEINYREARRAGVNFIRYDPRPEHPTGPPIQRTSRACNAKPGESAGARGASEKRRPAEPAEHRTGPPIQETAGDLIRLGPDGINVIVHDPSIRRDVELNPDLLVLSTGVETSDTEELASMLRLTRTPEGFFFEAHAKLRPVDFSSEGVFLAGLAHGPKSIPETISQASAAVARAATVLSKEKLRMSGIVSRVEPEHCAVCLTCVRACPYDVPFINEEHSAEINAALCQGCGICVAECPAKTIHLGRYLDKNLFAKISAFSERSDAFVSAMTKRRAHA